MPRESSGPKPTTARDHPELPFVGTLVADKYRIDAVLGAGGMGVVFAATHTLTGRRLALKWLLPELSADHESVERFMREAKFAGGIDHPNVISVHDVGFYKASVFIVMEYLEGEALSQVLERTPRLSVADALAVFLPALRGVAAAHARNVLHRDLKPENVFICRYADGSISNVKVLDFGISKMISTNVADPALTQSGAALGTPHYMPIEMFQADKDLDERVDVYAFGVMLYEVLTGKPPFDGLTQAELALAVSVGMPQRPRELCKEIPRWLEPVILKAMARDRDARYATLLELIAAIERKGKAKSKHERKRALLWAGCGALAIGAAAAWFTREPAAATSLPEVPVADATAATATSPTAPATAAAHAKLVDVFDAGTAPHPAAEAASAAAPTYPATNLVPTLARPVVPPIAPRSSPLPSGRLRVEDF